MSQQRILSHRLLTLSHPRNLLLPEIRALRTKTRGTSRESLPAQWEIKVRVPLLIRRGKIKNLGNNKNLARQTKILNLADIKSKSQAK